MSSRVTQQQVKAFVGEDTKIIIDNEMDIANRVVTEKFSNSGLGSDTLEKIELCLVAYFITRDGKEKLQDNKYGNMALALDKSGKLKNYSSGTPFRFTVLG